MCFEYSASPALIASLLKVCSGGFGTGGTLVVTAGNGIVAPSLKANNRAGPRLADGVAIELPVANNREADPQPTGARTYCSPFTKNVTGTEWIADPVLTDQTFFPPSAE